MILVQVELNGENRYLMLFFRWAVLTFRTWASASFGIALKLFQCVFSGPWMAVAQEEPKEVLKGTTLEVYRFLLKSNKPVGTRELQRALNLSSPSVATYHLSKLEDAGLLKREAGGFTVSKYLLENSVKVNRFLVPRYLFYAIFAVAALIIELTLFMPAALTRQYTFAVAVTGILAFFCTYETIKAQLRGNL